MDKAARLIQSWWLRPTLMTALERKATRQRRTAAAVVLQKIVRGFLARRHVTQSRALLQQQILEGRSARVIQRVARRFLLRNAMLRPQFSEHHHSAACIIQNAFRSYMVKLLEPLHEWQPLNFFVSSRKGQLND
jgi:IQ calmodulin-binding motif